MGIIRIQTGKRAGDDMETRMPQRGQFLASRWSRRILVSDEFADVDRSRLRTVCGQFVTAADACSRTVETVMRSRMRTVCDRVCGRGLSADMDSSRTRIVWDCVLFSDCSCSRICRVRGHERSISRDRFRSSPRLIRGHRILVTSRGLACPMLNMLSNTLPPFLLQLVSPALQLSDHGLDASNLFDGLRFDVRGMLVAEA